ncbi:hypothetical protein HDU82_007753 [Entophlyctis luteolus]|nr:hypothetical protein HDU82_007753 [Entophlyctis luteolus]
MAPTTFSPHHMFISPTESMFLPCELRGGVVQPVGPEQPLSRRVSFAQSEASIVSSATPQSASAVADAIFDSLLCSSPKATPIMRHLTAFGFDSVRRTPLASPQLPEQRPQLQLPSAAEANTTSPDMKTAALPVPMSRPRNHACSECGNRFLRRQDLQRHATTHSAARVFVCPFGCTASFGRSDGLTRHMRRGTCVAKMAKRQLKARKTAPTI